jgi:hypothetical protein
VLGFWARDQYVWSYEERKAIKLGLAGNVLKWLAVVAAFDEFKIVQRVVIGKLVFPIGKQPRLVLLEDLENQLLGVFEGAV